MKDAVDAVQRFNEANNDVIKLINHGAVVADEDREVQSDNVALSIVIIDFTVMIHRSFEGKQ